MPGDVDETLVSSTREWKNAETDDVRLRDIFKGGCERLCTSCKNTLRVVLSSKLINVFVRKPMGRNENEEWTDATSKGLFGKERS